MRTRLQTKPTEGELQANDRLLREVLARATELQGQREQAYSLEEMERIGVEVGVKPEFVRRAYAETIERMNQPHPTRRFSSLHACAIWWTCGWTLPVMIAVASHGHLAGAGALAFFAAWAVYLGGGLLITPMAQADSAPKVAEEK